LPRADEYIHNETLKLSTDGFCVNMDVEELKLATDMSYWMAKVQAQLSRRRHIKRMRKALVVHNFGACLCGCSDHLWEQDTAEARARKRRQVLASMAHGVVFALAAVTLEIHSQRPRTNRASVSPFATVVHMLMLPAACVLEPRAKASFSVCAWLPHPATADWLHTSICATMQACCGQVGAHLRVK
tara:strand:- start:323 stop:880 length:558 start_codon:yes stop_codon:yes gene_type:complete